MKHDIKTQISAKIMGDFFIMENEVNGPTNVKIR
jgi:hypothetical protein